MDRLITPAPTRVIWVYNKYFRSYHEVLGQLVNGIEFTPNFDYEAIMSKIEMDGGENSFLLIFDDILQLGDNLDLIFTRYFNIVYLIFE